MPAPTILVVDDDAPIVILMRSLLKEFGYETVTSLTGAQAIVLAQENRPDLVLLDKNMPGMSGEEVVRALRSEAHLEGVPIVILSGEPLAPDELARMGADAAVLKPFDVPSLMEEIARRVPRRN